MRLRKQLLWFAILFSSTLFLLLQFADLASVSTLQGSIFNWVNSKHRSTNVWEEYLGRELPAGECSDFLNHNESSLSRYRSNGRIQIQLEPQLSMECDDLRRRIIGHGISAKTNNSFAVARNVYKDYYLQEILLSASYSTENNYCYVLDVKSDKDFVTKMEKMASCLLNVVILDETFPFNSAGHYQNHAHYSCMTRLLSFPDWKYVMLLQNSDVIIKTPEEISFIMNILNGSPLLGFVEPFKKRIPTFELTAKSTNLFLNESLISDEQLNAPMVIRKSSTQMFLPRNFVEAMDDMLNVTTLMDIFNDKKKYGVDEMFFPTLISAHFLGLPGQVENKCKVGDAMRYVHWNFASEKSCKSFKKRHFVCLLGVEYLKKLSKTPQIIANKIWPEHDFGTLICIREMLNNRKMDNAHQIRLAKYYGILAQVREQEMKKRGAGASLFQC